MSIFTESLEKIKNGAPFRVNLKKRDLYVGRTCVIKDGICDDTDFPYSLDDLDRLYESYKHSVPTQGNHNTFYAIPEDELSDEDMMYGIDRHYAEAVLELTILKSLIDGSFVWESFVSNPDYFYWQSPYDDDFVIYRDQLF